MSGYIGYIVVTEKGDPMAPSVNLPGEPAFLWIERAAYLYKHRRTANRAIKRTLLFSKPEGLEWRRNDFRVIPVWAD